MTSVNKYYVYHFGGRCDGPYNFKEAIREKRYFDNIADYCMILKEVIDFEGKEVK